MTGGYDTSNIAASYMSPAANGAGSMKALQASKTFYIEAMAIVSVAMQQFNTDPFVDPNTSFIDVSA